MRYNAVKRDQLLHRSAKVNKLDNQGKEPIQPLVVVRNVKVHSVEKPQGKYQKILAYEDKGDGINFVLLYVEGTADAVADLRHDEIVSMTGYVLDYRVLRDATLEETAKEPVLFVVNYKDGTKAAALVLTKNTAGFSTTA
jgi:hypothetical protein